MVDPRRSGGTPRVTAPAAPGLIAERRAAAGQEIVKSAIGQRAQVTAPLQAIAHLALATRAGNGFAELGMIERHVAPHETEVLADVAARHRLGLSRPIPDPCLQPRPNPRNSLAEPLHLTSDTPLNRGTSSSAPERAIALVRSARCGAWPR